ncbi:MAG: hypothetical protein JWO49_16 [Arthrobacter sp.]|nr:hypothetical protein [Arthrobacter sp.]
MDSLSGSIRARTEEYFGKSDLSLIADKTGLQGVLPLFAAHGRRAGKKPHSNSGICRPGAGRRAPPKAGYFNEVSQKCRTILHLLVEPCDMFPEKACIAFTVSCQKE